MDRNFLRVAGILLITASLPHGSGAWAAPPTRVRPASPATGPTAQRGAGETGAPGAAVPAAMPTVVSAVPEDSRIQPWLLDRLARGETREMIVRLPDAVIDPQALPPTRPERTRAVYELLRRHAIGSQEPFVRWLASRGLTPKRFYLANMLLVRGDLALAREIAARPDVRRVEANPVVAGLEAPAVVSPRASGGVPSPFVPAAVSTGPEYGILAIGADLVWSAWATQGQGIVVMSADTGVEWDHPALIDHYRGWNGTVADHSYSWHDAIQGLAAPLDDLDHGTHTTGIMTGDDGGGNQIGVAPGAKWIACRNMDHGNGSPATYMECMEWALAPYPPGGNPLLDGRPDLSPDIVNNSWICPPSEGCSPDTLRVAFDTLRAAGILPVAAAGNAGSSCSSVNSPPAIYDSVLSAGATDSSDDIAFFSSRGPVTVDGSGRMKPDVSAPGVNVRSSVRLGGYALLSGTSMASPHVAGAAALMWSAKPELRPLLGITQCLLERTADVAGNPFAQTCGSDVLGTFPNNVTGWGRIDVSDALQATPDSDADGIADACDCAPSDSGAFEVPSAVTGLVFAADRETLSWDGQGALAGTATAFDLARGPLSDLHTGGGFTGATCLGPAIGGTIATDPQTPAAGGGYYYLARARNVCGVGSWGMNGTGAARILAVCP